MTLWLNLNFYSLSGQGGDKLLLEDTNLTSLDVSDILLTSVKVNCDPKCSTAREHLIDLSEGQWHPLDLTEDQLSSRRPQAVHLEDTWVTP